jgi:hypothetical protein
MLSERDVNRNGSIPLSSLSLFLLLYVAKNAEKNSHTKENVIPF